ncbi:BAG family molecular chaperone regulator 4 isoform X2 [Hevea brasiliensis]|uniref:BAG family molecular chaperone regulator 4 isoform X2 n=1 Tax=Hevea brasiliensis TaxID=3981 RepID=UPI000B7947CA|nr:BAG family molecular chaperone regulator 4 isoform X2 [Hevea brasiliensis]
MKKSASKGAESGGFDNRQIDWELRPGGMLVQKREVEGDPSGPMIKIKISHGSYHYEITVPAQSTFGVKDMSKVILLEDPACKERKLEEMKRNQGMLKAYEEVAKVRAEVDKLSQRVLTLETTVRNGTQVADQEFVVLTELLMMQLLKLDTIEANGEAKVQRRNEVRRVQNFVDTLDNLKARNSNPFSNGSNAVSVTTKWQTFECGVGSLSTPVPRQSVMKITQDWELFD